MDSGNSELGKISLVLKSPATCVSNMPVFRYELEQFIILKEKDTQRPIFMSGASFITTGTRNCSVLHAQ